MKICNLCRVEKVETDFYKNKKHKDGLQYKCKDCTKTIVIRWQKENKEKTNIKNRAYKQRNKPWRYEKAKAYTRDRYARRKTSTPIWADSEKILNIYLNCPVGFHVDHIIPLKGKNVCGLHVESNLQYLDIKSNLQKGNRY